MALNYLLDPVFQIENSAGKPATDGWLEVYIHGTRTKYYCASDFNGTLHPFKIPLDSLGSNIVLADDGQAYDVYAYNRFGSLLMSRYNVTPGKGGGSGGNVGEMQHWLGMYGPKYTPFPGDNARHTLGISKWEVDYVGDFIDHISTCPYPDGTTPRGYIYLKPGLYYVSCIIRYQQASDALSNTLDEILIYTGAGNENESLAYQMDSSGPEATGNRHNIRVQFIRRVPDNVSSSILCFAPGTPVDWKEAYIQKLEIIKLDSVAVSPTIVQGLEKVHHDGTLVGDGTVANPLGVDSDSVQKKLIPGNNITIDSDGVISAADGGETYTAGSHIYIDSDNVISATGLQEELTAGDGIDLDSDGNISVDPDIIPELPPILPLIAGENITIEDSDGLVVISAAGGESYSAGDGIDIDSDGVISVDSDEIPSEPVDFVPLIAGDNITFEDSDGSIVISATGGGQSYTAGENIEIDSDNVISAPDVQKKLTAGTNINIDSDGVINAELPQEEEVEFEELDLDDYQTKLTAGENITIDSDGVISAASGGEGNVFIANVGTTPYDDVKAAVDAGKAVIARLNRIQMGIVSDWTDIWGSPAYLFGVMLDQYQGGFPRRLLYRCRKLSNSTTEWVRMYDEQLATQSNVNSALNAKQDKLTAGANITIDSDNVISATGGSNYTAGDNINIDSDGVISAELPQEEEVQFEELDLDDYQTKLTAGEGIDIDSDGVISVKVGFINL